MDFRGFFIDFYDYHISYCKPPASQKERWSYVCTCWTFFGWVIFFSDPLDAKKIPPTNAARKSMNPCPRSSEAPIWKTSTSTGLMFTAMELAFDLVVVGIFVENPLQFVSLKVVFFGQWPLRCFRAQCWARFSTQKIWRRDMVALFWCDLSRSVEKEENTKRWRWNLNIFWKCRVSWWDNWTYSFSQIVAQPPQQKW